MPPIARAAMAAIRRSCQIRRCPLLERRHQAQQAQAAHCPGYIYGGIFSTVQQTTSTARRGFQPGFQVTLTPTVVTRRVPEPRGCVRARIDEAIERAGLSQTNRAFATRGRSSSTAAVSLSTNGSITNSPCCCRS